ncbi:hypothetical protein ACNO5E_13470 [Vibrio parahaemolyticus]|uniref:hypothetical protein n=1 Tax=Vibrio parahaemolyticus TaxID=670 RepID=UPI0008294AFB|nr:hypothetical protein [Vibrio parahaemolyticus]OCP68232.1 hypothetical protein AKH08_15555 [Vibrio parahaemolyticus]
MMKGLIASILLMLSFLAHAEKIDTTMWCERFNQVSKDMAKHNTTSELIDLRSKTAKTRNYAEYVAGDPQAHENQVTFLMERHSLSRADAETLYFQTMKPTMIRRIQAAIDAKMSKDEQRFWNDEYKACLEKAREYLTSQGIPSY